jgi:hypothetical protein
MRIQYQQLLNAQGQIFYNAPQIVPQSMHIVDQQSPEHQQFPFVMQQAKAPANQSGTQRRRASQNIRQEPVPKDLDIRMNRLKRSSLSSDLRAEASQTKANSRQSSFARRAGAAAGPIKHYPKIAPWAWARQHTCKISSSSSI